MENITKGAFVCKSVPAAGEMALINAQALRKLKEEEVFTFRVAAADTRVDRDFEHFSRECLEKLAELYVGKTFIADHQWSSGKQVARVYAGTVETTEDGVSRLILSCYMLRSEATQPVIDAIEAGINREVSVGVAVNSAVCSICGADKAHGYCEHRPGKAYDGTLCTVELRDPVEAYEVSFVAVPAQREAGVVKSYEGYKLPQSASLTAPSEREPVGSSSRKASLFEGGGAAAGGDGGSIQDAARRRALAAMIELEKAKIFEEV